LSLTTVSGQPTITGVTASITCGVTGAAAYSMTLSTPGGPLVLNCPNVAAPGTTVTVTSQIAYGLSSGGQTFGPGAGGGSVNITTNPGCEWNVFNIPSWIIITNAVSGTSNGTVSYQVAPNPGPYRSATLTFTNVSFTVEQGSASIPGINFIGSMPHIAAEENWTTAFTLVNKGVASAQTRLNLSGDAANPGGNGPLMLPLVFPQQAAASGPLLASSL
jgi:hypothetical protein